jgi:hypothetical protein
MSLNLGSSKVLFSYRLFLFQTYYLVGETGVWGHWNGCGDLAFSFPYKLRHFFKLGKFLTLLMIHLKVEIIVLANRNQMM